MPQSNQVIAVSPVVVSRSVAPGSTITVPITVDDETDRAFGFATGFEDIAPSSDRSSTTGYRALGSVRAPDGRGARDWASATPTTFPLRAGGRQTVTVTVRVPPNAAPGGHYAQLFVTALPTGGGASVAIRSRVGVVFLLTVAGALRYDMPVTVDPHPRLLLHGQLAVDVTADNRGNVHQQLSGSVVAHLLFGGARSVSLRPEVVLPGARRTERIRVALPAAPDIARLQFDPSRSEVAHVRASESQRVAAIPWWFALGIVLIIAVVFVRIRQLRAADRSHDEWDPADPV